MRNTNTSNNDNSPEDQRKKDLSQALIPDSIRPSGMLLKGHSIPGKILLTGRSDPLDESSLQEQYTEYERSFSYKEAGSSDCLAKAAEKSCELAWSGIPDYMRPDVWRLLLGYAPPNSDGKEGVLRRKRLEDLECLSQYYDIADTERSDDEINMLCQAQ
ncbi:tbc1 domain family member 22a [Quercus suber]|uniref:Tbc1 domain family member 22a n=1 Tax=Quercus suber TaxID=58331 RepID=A0AAW0KPC0_QUESU